MAGARSFFDDGATAAICGRCAYAYVRRGFRGAAASAVNGSSPGWSACPAPLAGSQSSERSLASCEGSWPAQRTDRGEGGGGRGGRPEPRGEVALLRARPRVSEFKYIRPLHYAITAAPTKRPLTFSVLQPAVVTVTLGSAWTPVATELYFRKGQTWFAFIWPQREQRYFLVSLPSFLVFRDGAGEIDVVSGSTKSGSAAFVGFRRRPVLRAAREGF